MNEICDNDIDNVKLAKSIAIEISRAIDPYTAYHLDNVSKITKEIAVRVKDKFNLTDVQIEFLTIFSSLHDIGKIAIPNEVLYKTGKLTNTERVMIETHPIIGKSIVDRALVNSIYLEQAKPYLNILNDVVYSHHERIDGSGYPLGLKGDEVTPFTRIISMADCFDAMTSDRAYRKPFPIEKAVQIIEGMVNDGALDRDCFNALLDIINTSAYN